MVDTESINRLAWQRSAEDLGYELDDDLKPIKSYYLGDPDAAKRAAERVAAQAAGGNKK